MMEYTRWECFVGSVRRMLHIHTEGGAFRSGINFTFGRWWLRLTWISVDFNDYTAVTTSVRFRLFPHHPKIFYSRTVGNIVEWYLVTHNQFLLGQDMVEDGDFTQFPGGFMVYPKNPPKSTFRRM